MQRVINSGTKWGIQCLTICSEYVHIDPSHSISHGVFRRIQPQFKSNDGIRRKRNLHVRSCIHRFVHLRRHLLKNTKVHTNINQIRAANMLWTWNNTLNTWLRRNDMGQHWYPIMIYVIPSKDLWTSFRPSTLPMSWGWCMIQQQQRRWLIFLKLLAPGSEHNRRSSLPE